MWPFHGDTVLQQVKYRIHVRVTIPHYHHHRVSYDFIFLTPHRHWRRERSHKMTTESSPLLQNAPESGYTTPNPGLEQPSDSVIEQQAQDASHFVFVSDKLMDLSLISSWLLYYCVRYYLWQLASFLWPWTKRLSFLVRDPVTNSNCAGPTLFLVLRSLCIHREWIESASKYQLDCHCLPLNDYQLPVSSVQFTSSIRLLTHLHEKAIVWQAQRHFRAEELFAICLYHFRYWMPLMWNFTEYDRAGGK
jgi:hypothetical protein